MNTKQLLIIGQVWPEPESSAAGTRMIQLVKLFLSQGYHICFASAASKSEFSFNLDQLGVQEQEIKLNDYSFNLFLKNLDPGLVLFDRFMIEEQYGWRLRQECPGALLLLDTEDLHFLRHARQQAIKKEKPEDLFTDLTKREIASILRCDLSLIISEAEMHLLEQQFHIDPALLYYLPFLEEELTAEQIGHWKTYEQREGFVFIGNFLHEPNWHTVQILKTEIWPWLRKRLPGTSLNIYGAYPSQKVLQLHHEKEKFYVHGRAKNAIEAISKHKILLAPIQFGAGLKGKFIDAMRSGTPTVTTPAGAEAMKGKLQWNGALTDNYQDFISAAAALYQDKAQWLEAGKNGIRILNERYGKAKFEAAFIRKVNHLQTHLSVHRQQNFFGQLLQYHTANSTKYMSLWIEEKNKKN